MTNPIDALAALLSPGQAGNGSGNPLAALFQPVAMRDDPLNPNVTQGAGGGGLAVRGAPAPAAPQQTILEPAGTKASWYLKQTKGDLAHALAAVDTNPALQRVPGYYAEIKNAIIRQADPAEFKRLYNLETAQERLGGDLYGGEPRGLVNWLRLQSPGGALEPPTVNPQE
jgi:hypothetical protein